MADFAEPAGMAPVVDWWRANDLKARFMAAGADYQAARMVLLGAPLDCTASFRPGSRFGPAAIRQVSEALEEFSVYQQRDLRETAFFDAGDLILPFGNPASSLELIGQAVENILAPAKIPFLLGGEHLLSLAAVTACQQRFPELRVLHLDAHTDLRPDYLGQELSHATVMRRVAELLGPGRVYQFGIRSGERGDFAYAKTQTKLFLEELLQPFQSVLAELQPYPLYVTIDIDLIDPAFAPGTGTPEPGGIRPRELFEFIWQLNSLKVVGIDLVELAPAYDPSGITALLGAKLVREILLALAG